MSAAQVKRAQQLIEQVAKAKTLVGKQGNALGTIRREYTGEIVLSLREGTTDFSITTLEKWIKQAKVVARKGYV